MKGYVLPTKLNSFHDGLSPIHKDRLLRKEEYKSVLYGVQDVKDILVLICGHGGRDARCGAFGPVLNAEFEKVLECQEIAVQRSAIQVRGPAQNDEKLPLAGPAIEGESTISARVGLISHIGGHKFAGNVIIYLPPGLKTANSEDHPLAGCGIWYGRVEPKHVDGIVKETILNGKVIEEFFRGGIRKGGEILRV